MLDLRSLTDDFAVAPQIAPNDLADVKGRGFVMVVSNRPDGEEPGQPSAADISNAAESAGLAFRHIPVAGNFADAQIADMATALSDADGPVFAFCRSGTRSTFLWSLARASRGGDLDEIAAAAAAVGYDIAPVRAAIEKLAASS